MSTAKKERYRFRAGDWVRFRYGTKDLIAQVTEARGPIGVHGRRLYRVSIPRDAAESDSFEMPEDELDGVSAPDTAAMIRYLTEGGLVEILRSNLGGGRTQPKAWLTYAPRGDIIHTFSPEQGLVGGATVPCYALYEGKVFTGKKDEVAAFLGSFGLGPTEVRRIVAEVGTAP
jgi:hypothetical protein